MLYVTDEKENRRYGIFFMLAAFLNRIWFENVNWLYFCFVYYGMKFCQSWADNILFN